MLHEYYQTDVAKPMAKLLPRSESPMKTLFWRSFETAKSLGWNIVDHNEAEGRIEATAASFWFGRAAIRWRSRFDTNGRRVGISFARFT